MRRSLVVLCVLLFCAVSCSAEAAEESRPTPIASPQQAPPARPAAHIGQTLDLMRIGGQKIAVTLTEIINPATVPNGWGEPGKTYIATKLRIENAGTTTIVGNSNSDVSVIGSDHQSYQADFATVTECQDFAYGWFLLAAGSSSTGCVVFALPSGVTATKVRYAPSSGISHDVGEWVTR
ncbi:DUF4352 domain-containing protein [Mycolicibacter terrae]|uniref:DUF4352 domain-containing protein n=2 Tax=Mycolicibacter TaxID=1073531 RepID=A0A1A2NW32_MYCSD|nr:MULTISPECIES: DUF4352 domain-containing protein [Mycolicibacter]OBH19294.1 hypothetical protein A5694_19295 [Mycolicibacter sinensis]OBI26756.1 hypothetical protein A5710_06445 [Mycolicibacter sinensis]RRR47929.1 DUF4352 domain-containing protein [Mycolicibacter terrae]